ncbi:hypothetical protein M405DRAFT_870521 [Rhizopogon salebrosus TDB-379]|nr:hypothetical protein M405DRAFT_870521 [Rhizopogon salebrosus TDB-379]
MRTNHGQIIPYISKDLQEHQCIYGTVSRVYAELFEWVRQMMDSDRHLCLVIPIGHFVGGAFCLLENGLVLELRSDYKGSRASLVFQTDKEFAAWVRDHNGWVDNMTMRSFI